MKMMMMMPPGETDERMKRLREKVESCCTKDTSMKGRRGNELFVYQYAREKEQKEDEMKEANHGRRPLSSSSFSSSLERDQDASGRIVLSSAYVADILDILLDYLFMRLKKKTTIDGKMLLGQKDLLLDAALVGMFQQAPLQSCRRGCTGYRHTHLSLSFTGELARYIYVG